MTKNSKEKEAKAKESKGLGLLVKGRGYSNFFTLFVLLRWYPQILHSTPMPQYKFNFVVNSIRKT